jgi:hypothetical protein
MQNHNHNLHHQKINSLQNYAAFNEDKIIAIFDNYTVQIEDIINMKSSYLTYKSTPTSTTCATMHVLRATPKGRTTKDNVHETTCPRHEFRPQRDDYVEDMSD